MSVDYGDWEPVIGLEVHAQLLTRTKLFCACETSFGDPPNTHTCPVCLGLPGALPVLNRMAVRLAVTAALALSCQIRERSVFARKNYFYPDLPKGYQISQYEEPFSKDGSVTLGTGKLARIHRIHMEEDAGKNLHAIGEQSIVDLNRAGTPLVEIVGEPDLASAAEAADYLKRVRETLMYVGVNDGNLEQGSFRCDANVSIRRRGDARLGVRTELKNINSFRFVEDAIDREVRRQIGLVESGQAIKQQTRGYNADKKETYPLRDKEGDAGYRYFPEPDLAPLTIVPAFVAEVRAAMPELPDARRARYNHQLGLKPYAAQVLTGHPSIAAYFDAVLECLRKGGASEPGDVEKAANFVQAEILRDVVTTGLEATYPITPRQVAAILSLVKAGTISGKQAKEVYAKVAGTDRDPADVVRDEGMAVMSDAEELERLTRDLVDKNPKQVEQYRAGKKTMLGFFVGQIMKSTKGSADPKLVNEILVRMLEG